MNLGRLYLDSVMRQMTLSKQLAEKTFEQISDAEFHYCPSEESNSIAVLIQHISGNMISRWTNFLTEDGEKPWRERDKEFETEQHTKTYLLQGWEKGWECMFA
ncbi:MAG TPA: DUF1572 family protein, partial [Puia sp.]|nr:DUF1572 family protein [Puia sp.]